MEHTTRNSVIAAQLSAIAARLDAILAPLEDDIAAIKTQMIGDDNYCEKADKDQKKNMVVEDILMGDKRDTTPLWRDDVAALKIVMFRNRTSNQASPPAPAPAPFPRPVASPPAPTPPPQHQTRTPPSPTTITTLIPTQCPSLFAHPPAPTPSPSTTLLEILMQPTPTYLLRPPWQPPTLDVRIAPNTTGRHEWRPPWTTDMSPTTFRRLEWHPPWDSDTGQQYKPQDKPPESQNSAQFHHLAVEPFEEDLNERIAPFPPTDLRTSRFSGAEALIRNRGFDPVVMGQNPVAMGLVQLGISSCFDSVKSISKDVGYWGRS